MLTFCIVEVVVRVFPDDLLASFASDLFEILGCYFPIHFTHVSLVYLDKPYSVYPYAFFLYLNWHRLIWAVQYRKEAGFIWLITYNINLRSLFRYIWSILLFHVHLYHICNFIRIFEVSIYDCNLSFQYWGCYFLVLSSMHLLVCLWSILFVSRHVHGFVVLGFLTHIREATHYLI